MELVEFQTQDISTYRIPWVLCDLHHKKKSGILHVMASNKTMGRRFYIIDGALKFAISNQETDRFGRLLLEMGIITQEQFTRTMLKMDGSQRFGQLLVNQGFVSQEQLENLVDNQVLDIVYSTFELDSGLFFFEERELSLPDDLMRHFDFPALILKGARTMRNLILLHDEMERFLEQPIVFCRNPIAPLQDLPLEPKEAYAVSRVDGMMDLDQLGRISKLDEEHFRRLMFAMFCLRVVQLKPVEEDLVNRFDALQQEQEDAPHLMSLGRFAPREMEERKKIIKKYAEVKTETLWNFLEVPMRHTKEELKSAFIKLNKSFHPDIYRQPHLRDLRNYLNRIISHLNLAYNVLSDPQKARDYQESQRALMASKDISFTSEERRKLAEEPYKLGRRFLAQEDLFNAHRYLEQAVKLNPDEPRYWVDLGQLEMRNPKWNSKAKASFQRALQLNPTMADAHFGLAKLSLAAEDQNGCVARLRQVLDFDPTHEAAAELLESLSREQTSSGIFDRIRNIGKTAPK